MPRSSGESHTSGFPWKADSPRFADDGRTHAGEGRDGSGRCSARNPRSSVTAARPRSLRWGARRGAWSDKASGTGNRNGHDHSLSRAAQRRWIVAWTRQSQVTATGQSDVLPRTPHRQGNGSRQRFGVVPPGLGRVGDEYSFPAWGLRHQTIACLLNRVLADLEHPMDETAARRRKPTSREGEPLYIVT